MQTLSQPVAAQTARQKLIDLQAELNGMFFEMEEVIRAILCGTLSRQNTILFGPPGVAKTALTEAVSQAFVGSQYFYTLMHRQQPAEEIFGPPAPSKLISNDEFIRNTKNRLPEAHFAFFDEIGRGSPTIRGMLLRAVNERKFEQNGILQDMPLISAIAASNQFLTDAEDQAIYDRFSFRLWVDDPTFTESWEDLIRMEHEPSSTVEISLDELYAMQQEVAALPFPEEAVQLLVQIRTKLAQENIRISPRRIRQIKKALRAYAYLDGANQVGSDHFEVLSYTVWDQLKDRADVVKVVTDVAMPSAARIMQCLDAATKRVRDLGAAPGPTADANTKQTWSNQAIDAQTELRQQKDAIAVVLSNNPSSTRAANAIRQIEALERQVQKSLQAMMGWNV